MTKSLYEKKERKKDKETIQHPSFGGRAGGVTSLQDGFSGFHFQLKTDPSSPQQEPPSGKGLNTAGRATLTIGDHSFSADIAQC